MHVRSIAIRLIDELRTVGNLVVVRAVDEARIDVLLLGNIITNLIVFDLLLNVLSMVLCLVGSSSPQSRLLFARSHVWHAHCLILV